MKYLVAILLLATSWIVPAQTPEPTLDVGALVDAAQQFAQDNLDDDVLKALQSVDRAQVEGFLKRYQDYLKGDSVLDVAQLQAAAVTILPLLDAHPETQTYAAWLRARLDYFDAAEEMKQLPPPTPGINGPPVRLNPSFAAEQTIWIKKITPRPWPPGAKEYVPKLKSVFAAELVPAELVWLAEVESGFNATARSPAGAVGMFQLMPATAQDLGLRLFPFDQRKQVEPAGRAAAKLLRHLYGKFGDWRLAVAAYNCGEGAVQKMLKRYGASSYERIATHLPAETQMYVPKVEATILHREGAALEQLKAA